MKKRDLKVSKGLAILCSLRLIRPSPGGQTGRTIQFPLIVADALAGVNPCWERRTTFFVCSMPQGCFLRHGKGEKIRCARVQPVDRLRGGGRGFAGRRARISTGFFAVSRMRRRTSCPLSLKPSTCRYGGERAVSPCVTPKKACSVSLRMRACV